MATLTKKQLFEKAKEGAAPEEFQEVMIRRLSAADYQRLQGILTQAALHPPDVDKTEEHFKMQEAAGWLHFGVVEPELSMEEWVSLLEVGSNAYLMPIQQRIKELSGVVPLAAKTVPTLPAATTSEAIPPDSNS